MSLVRNLVQPVHSPLSRALTEGGRALAYLLTEEGLPLLTEEIVVIHLEPNNA
jgi:hypothetical protein